MIELGEMLGDHFDRVILYEDHYVRGRAEGEIMRLMRQGVAARQARPRGRGNSRLDRRRRAGAWRPCSRASCCSCKPTRST